MEMSSDEQRKGLNGDQHDGPDAARATPRTATSQKTPNVYGLYEPVKQWLYQRYGLFGLVVLLVLAGVVGTWWNSDTVRTRPGTEQMLAWFDQSGLPEAYPRRFTVALVHLANDEDRQYGNLILAAFGPHASSATPQPSTSQKTPDVNEELKRQFYQRYGLWGLVVLSVILLVIGGVFEIWRNWNTARTRPGIKQILAWFDRSELPKADPERFTVALAHLEHDEAGQSEKLILEALDEQFASREKNAVQILCFDRTIQREGADPEASVNAAHKEARAYLDQSGADVLIWGAVLKGGDKRVPKLFWTPRSDLERVRDAERYPMQALELPEVFFAHLAEILRLLVVTGDAEFRSLEGRFVADRIGPFIERVRTLLSSGGKGWSKESRARVRSVLANSLLTLGQQTGTNDALLEAIVLYREILQDLTRERVPLHWAMTQNNLGNALWSLGERESGTTRLEEAIAGYREALKEWTRERVPLQWAMTQNNLGTALTRLGERESGTAPLEEAIAAYREALKEWTRERVPLDWAMTQNNLGDALRTLGERESGTARLEKAIVAHHEALKEWTRERVPLQWAATQNNLGNALARLGERESGTARLEEAIAAYHEALKEWTRERVPLQWAGTQNNLGNALLSLGERESGTARLEEAIAAYREALKEWTRERVPLQWAGTQSNLGSALARLGEREEDVTLVCEALRAFLDAWALFASTGASHNTSGLERNIEINLQLLKDRFTARDYEACLAKHTQLLDSFFSSRQ